MIQYKLECVEVIQIREPVQKFQICTDKIIVLTQNSVLKVLVCLPTVFLIVVSTN
jgi:hypothetical protein